MDYTRWKSLMDSFGIGKNRGTWEELVKGYSEKHRYYHTGEHVNSLLAWLDRYEDLAGRPDELELALWFHDAIYDPLSKDNELRSAEWAAGFIEKNGLSYETAQRVKGLILSTMHSAVPVHADEQLIVDIDLSILGAPPEVFQEYENNVRKEYSMVPLSIYKEKRKDVLNSFLGRQRIYQVKEFRHQLEEQARLNLSAAISKL